MGFADVQVADGVGDPAPDRHAGDVARFLQFEVPAGGVVPRLLAVLLDELDSGALNVQVRNGH